MTSDAGEIVAPDIYEHDLRCVVEMIDALRAIDATDLLIAAGTSVVVWSKNDYPIGTLAYEEDQWRLTPHADWLSYSCSTERGTDGR